MKVELIERSMRFDDHSQGNKKRPLLMSMLSVMIRKFNLNSPPLLQLATTLMVAHNGLLRGGEVWSGLIVADILWHTDGRGFGLQLGRTKTNRTGGPVVITLRSNSSTALSAVNMMRIWFDKRKLWEQHRRRLFPGFSKGKGGMEEDREEGGSKVAWIEFMREQLREMGWDEMEFAGHSLRAGGATDLFNSNIPLATIMKIGRWESVQAAMMYFRDDMVIAQEAAEAFSKCSK